MSIISELARVLCGEDGVLRIIERLGDAGQIRICGRSLGRTVGVSGLGHGGPVWGIVVTRGRCDYGANDWAGRVGFDMMRGIGLVRAVSHNPVVETSSWSLTGIR